MKKLFVLGLVLVMSMSLAACLPGGGGGEDVWEEYSGEYFGFKYPEEWSVVEDEEDEELERYTVIVGDTENTDEMEEGFVVNYDLDGDNTVSGDEWDERLERLEQGRTAEEEGEIIEFDEYEIDGYSAGDGKYEEEIDGDLYYINEIPVYKDDDELVHSLVYIGIEDKYNEEMKEDIIGSFEFN